MDDYFQYEEVREIVSISDWVVTAVFADGSTRKVDMGRIIQGLKPSGYKTALENPETFSTLRLEHGAFTWTDANMGLLDMAPEVIWHSSAVVE